MKMDKSMAMFLASQLFVATSFVVMDNTKRWFGCIVLAALNMIGSAVV
jgi:hypothetical protein